MQRLALLDQGVNLVVQGTGYGGFEGGADGVRGRRLSGSVLRRGRGRERRQAVVRPARHRVVRKRNVTPGVFLKLLLLAAAVNQHGGVGEGLFVSVLRALPDAAALLRLCALDKHVKLRAVGAAAAQGCRRGRGHVGGRRGRGALLDPHPLETVRQSGNLDGVPLLGVLRVPRRGSVEKRLRHLLQRVGDGQAVLLERLDRVVHPPGDDQVRVAAGDVRVARQVRRAVGGPRVGVGVRRGWPVHVCSHDVRGWVLLGLLQLDICELRDTDGPHHGPPLRGVGVRRRTVEAGAQMEGIVMVLGCSAVLPSDLRLAVHQMVRPAVGVGVSDIQVPHGVALPVLLGQEHPSSAGLLTHHRLVIRRGAVGRRDEGAVAVRGDVVRPGDVAGDGGVGGHGRGLVVVLGVGQRAGAVGAVHAAVP